MKTYPNEQLKVSLPEGFTNRAATLDDLDEVVKLLNCWSQNLIGEDDITDIAALRNEMELPGFTPEEDARFVFDPDGKLVAYVDVWSDSKPPVHPWITGRVHPGYEGMGIGSWLMQWGEERAMNALSRVPEDLRFAPRTGVNEEATDSKKLFDDFGYKHIRSFYRMVIDMDEMVPEPEWPAGITLRTYNPEKDAEVVYRADTESFRDHFGFVEQPYEEGLRDFIHVMTKYDGFDPTLWFLAMDGDELAGISLCRPRAFDNPESGFVNILAVRRPWRGRGLGLALLRHSFNEFYRRGKRTVSLGVDAHNLTGALHLYEKAGMHVHRQFDTYEKELRPGREISVQSLSE